MAVSMHWKLLAAAAAFTTLAFGACGDDNDNGGNDTPDGGGGMDAGRADGGGLPQLPTADLDDDVAGKPCMEDSECGGTNATCTAFGDSPGVCTGACTEDSQCGAGGKCITITVLGTTLGNCAKTCTVDGDCASGQECREGLDLGDIISMIDAGVGLGDGSVSNNSSSTCQAKPNTVQLGDGVAGSACTEGGSECGSGTCTLEAFGMPYPGGYCSGSCTESAQCGAGGACVGAVAFLGVPGNCVATCTAPADCRTGYGCRSLPIGGGSSQYCLPGTSDAGAPEGGTPDASAPDASEPDATVEVEAGT